MYFLLAKYLAPTVVGFWLLFRLISLRQPERRRLSKTDYILFLVCGILIVRGLFLDFFVVTSRSMQPTLEVRDVLLAEKWRYYGELPKRGEVILFKHPQSKWGRVMVKRALGLPGDLISSEENKFLINGEVVDGVPPTPALRAISTIPRGQYLVFGDNRGNSSDSRHYGLVPQEFLLAPATRILFPFNRSGPIDTK